MVYPPKCDPRKKFDNNVKDSQMRGETASPIPTKWCRNYDRRNETWAQRKAKNLEVTQ